MSIEFDYDEQSFNKSFGERVRNARGELDWSQRKLAEALEGLGVKLDPSAVTRIERGTRDVKLREAAAIAAALGLSLEDLSPAPTASPREHLESCLQVAFRHGGDARASLASMAMYFAAAMHLIDRRPELLGELNVGSTYEFVEAMQQGIAEALASTPAANATDRENAAMLMTLVNAVVTNLIGIESEQTSKESEGASET